MSYLSFDCFDPNIGDSTIDDYILSGEYVLQAYAESHWLDHVMAGGRNISGSPTLDDLCHAVLEFKSARGNPDFHNTEIATKRQTSALRGFRQSPLAYSWLDVVCSFASSDRQSLEAEDGKPAPTPLGAEY